jgi:hypothetical protein
MGAIVFGLLVAIAERFQRSDRSETLGGFSATLEGPWRGPVPGRIRRYPREMGHVLEGITAGLSGKGIAFKGFHVPLDGLEGPLDGVVLEMERKSILVLLWPHGGSETATNVHVGPMMPENRAAIQGLCNVIDDHLGS